ncbi:MAG TPA: autotransporter domain-containing protein [Rhodocyclaceae bacterium]|nr:autotransporter domain-containing protein [Rhodocyclaceae bacterium]
MLKPRLAAASIGALIVMPTVAGADSSPVFFGDSLTDSGFYAPLLPPGTGRFTTNPGPVWSELFAEGIGTTAVPSNAGGSNFAAGGARVSRLPGIPPSPPTDAAPPLTTQVAAYLAGRGGQADGKALHFVWAGANDIFFIAADAAAAPAYLRLTAAEAAAEIARLSAAGARHIVVFNLPDIGATPFGTAQGPAGAAGLTALSAAYNGLLFESIAASGVSVIGLDTFALLNEVKTDPARYGFANVTLPACGTTPSLLCTGADFVVPGAEQTFLFADGVHPTTAGHRVIAQYVVGTLAAPRQIGLLPEVPVRNQIALARQLWRNAAHTLQATEVGRMHGWVSAGGGELEIRGHDATPSTVTIGGDRRLSERVAVGAALSYSESRLDWGRAGSFGLEDLALSAYGGYRVDALSLSASVSFSKLDFDTRRRVALGAATREHRGRVEGSRIAAGVELAYAFEFGSLVHGPVASVLLQRVTVPSFDERATDGSVSTSLAYGRQRRKSALFSAGWQAQFDAGKLTPYLRVMANHDAEAGGRSLRMTGPASTSSYKLPTASVPKSYASANAGVAAQLANGMRIALDVDTVIGKKALEDTRITAALQIPF